MYLDSKTKTIYGHLPSLCSTKNIEGIAAFVTGPDAEMYQHRFFGLLNEKKNMDSLTENLLR